MDLAEERLDEMGVQNPLHLGDESRSQESIFDELKGDFISSKMPLYLKKPSKKGYSLIEENYNKSFD